jgi:ParB family chromosome partitioning protein
MRQGGLGKGLSALIPSESAAKVRDTQTTGPQLVDIPIGEVGPNPHQPRQHFEEDALASLAASISEIGVLQPILVRMAAPGSGINFELIAGERRWRAAQRAGLTSIPAVIREVTDQASMEQALVENLHRQDLNAMEEAGAYLQLIEDFSLTHDQVAKRVGKSRVTVTNMIRLFNLAAPVQRLVREGRLTGGHARTILGVTDPAGQEALAQECVANGYTVRQLEERVRQIVNPQAEESGSSIDLTQTAGEDMTSTRSTESSTTSTMSTMRPVRDPGLIEVENLLAEALSTRVNIEMSNANSKGRVVIDVADLADLERVFRLIMAAN